MRLSRGKNPLIRPSETWDPKEKEKQMKIKETAVYTKKPVDLPSALCIYGLVFAAIVFALCMTATLPPVMRHLRHSHGEPTVEIYTERGAFTK